MFKIVNKKYLNDSVCEMVIEAERVAKKAKAGQFIILRVDEEGERIPLTIADFDKEKGLVKIIFQIIGATTAKLSQKKPGDEICDFVGPLGNASDIEGLSNVCVVGGGVGCAIALPIAKALNESNAEVVSVVGFRSKEIMILKDEFEKVSKELFVATDDGSFGEKGNVCLPLRKMLENGKKFDKIFAIGPLVMMKYVSLLAQEFDVPCVVSMNPIMIDGTGMCGGCRLSVGGVQKFACVDGPEFDGSLVDFDEAINRNRNYLEFENIERERYCNLFKKEIV